MRLTSLTLTGFRPFRETTQIDLKPGVNLFLAENGVGKTSLLDGAAFALAGLLGRETPALSWRDLHRSLQAPDARTVRRLDIAISATLDAGQSPLSFNRWALRRDANGGYGLTLPKAERSEQDAAPFSQWVDEQIDKSGPLPLLASLPALRAERGDLEAPVPAHAPKWRERRQVMMGSGALSNTWSHLRDQMAQHHLNVTAFGNPESKALLSTVHGALERALDAPEGQGPIAHIDSGFVPDLVVQLPGLGPCPGGFMSDGWRAYVSLILALALQAAALHPNNPDAALHCPGVVLIDELEQHQHPRLQLKALDGLRRAFPHVQFLVSTHSPLVITDALDDARDQILRIFADEEGHPRIETLPSVRGLDAIEVLTGPWFGLPSTLDDDTLGLMAQQRALLHAEVVDEAAVAPIVEELRRRRGDWAETAMERLVLSVVATLEAELGHRLHSYADIRRLRKEVLHRIRSGMDG